MSQTKKKEEEEVSPERVRYVAAVLRYTKDVMARIKPSDVDRVVFRELIGGGLCVDIPLVGFLFRPQLHELSASFRSTFIPDLIKMLRYRVVQLQKEKQEAKDPATVQYITALAHCTERVMGCVRPADLDSVVFTQQPNDVLHVQLPSTGRTEDFFFPAQLHDMSVQYRAVFTRSLVKSLRFRVVQLRVQFARIRKQQKQDALQVVNMAFAKQSNSITSPTPASTPVPQADILVPNASMPALVLGPSALVI